MIRSITLRHCIAHTIHCLFSDRLLVVDASAGFPPDRSGITEIAGPMGPFCTTMTWEDIAWIASVPSPVNLYGTQTLHLPLAVCSSIMTSVTGAGGRSDAGCSERDQLSRGRCDCCRDECCRHSGGDCGVESRRKFARNPPVCSDLWACLGRLVVRTGPQPGWGDRHCGCPPTLRCGGCSRAWIEAGDPCGRWRPAREGYSESAGAGGYCGAARPTDPLGSVPRRERRCRA